MQKINPPTNCPSCDSILEWKKDVLYCINESCGSRVEKAIEHWGKTLKIKGLGPKTIEKLELDSIMDLYWLSPECIEASLGSEKMASKLYSEIQKSTQASLNLVLPAFGVPLIGKSASDKICSKISTLDELTKSKCEEAGLGPKATFNLMGWYHDLFADHISEGMTFNPKSEKHVFTDPVAIRGTVCISGKLKSFKTKAEAEKTLTKQGYLVKSSLTKDVTILVNESGIESAKTTKARKSGITIVEDLNVFLGE
jgi:NAD-dependent DNA ligase